MGLDGCLDYLHTMTVWLVGAHCPSNRELSAHSSTSGQHFFRSLVLETGSAKTVSAIDVRIDDMGCMLNLRICFSPRFSALASQLRPRFLTGLGGIGS